MPDRTPAPPPRRYVTAKDAAAYAGVSLPTIQRALRRGHLTAFRLGPNILRVDLGEIDALLDPDNPRGRS